MSSHHPEKRRRLAEWTRIGLLGALGAGMGPLFPAAAQQPGSASVLIYDASGSMWGQLDGGVTKVETARDVIGDFFASRDNSVPLGVIAYGHNRRGDCTDIETIANVGVNDPSDLSARLNSLNPRGMTPITDSLSLAASMIPQTAESADIILVTDGLETCEADPCALAAQLAAEGIAIRAHVVGFGLTTQEAAAMACVADATGGLLLTPQTGQELAEALNQIAAVEPAPQPQPQPQPQPEAAFDIGDKAEAGFNYSIRWNGEATYVDYIGFVPQGGTDMTQAVSYGPIGGTAAAPNNPVTRTAPTEPGLYDLVLVTASAGIIARQAVEVVPPSNGFDAVGSVEPDKRFEFTWRGPNQVGHRIAIARPGAAPDDHTDSWGNPYSNRTTQRMGLRAPAEPGVYELRYLSGNLQEILFFREFGVGVPFEDSDLTNTTDLATQAAAATQAAPGQDAMPMVRATFRIPDTFPQIPLSWDAVPLDPDMSPEAWSPISEMIVGEGEFEPGRYRVSATGPGEVRFSAEVEIYPGQNTDFIIAAVDESDDEAAATTLDGPWQVIGVPPYQVQAGADQLLTLALEQAQPDGPIGGSWTAYERLAGPPVAGREGPFTTATQDGDVLRLTFTVGAPIPEPMTLYVTPYGIGYAGTLSSGGMGLSVVMWPGGYVPPSLSEMRAAVHGPAPSDFVDMTASAPSAQATDPAPDDTAFRCTDSPAGCPVRHEASGISLTLPNNWTMTEPYFYETAGGARADLPTASFTAQDLGKTITVELNPRQWMDANGPCRDIGASRLCMASGQGMGADIGFEGIAMTLQIAQGGAAAPEGGIPVDLGGRDPEVILRQLFGNPSGD